MIKNMAAAQVVLQYLWQMVLNMPFQDVEGVTGVKMNEKQEEEAK